MRMFLLSLVILFYALPPADAALSSSQRNYATKAFAAAERHEWESARALARKTRDRLTQDLIDWHYATSNGNEPDFALVKKLLKDHPDWPLREGLQRRAERALLREGRSRSTVEDWLKKYPAVSGAGNAALGLALGEGDKRRADFLRAAWREGGFGGDAETRFLSRARGYLRGSDHKARIERLLWDGQPRAAARMLSFMPKSSHALYEARIGLQQRAHNVNTLVSKVPSAQKKDYGLRYDRMVWRHKKGLSSGALEILRSIPASAPYGEKWWKYRAIYGRDMIEARQYRSAHVLFKNHGVPKAHVGAFADAMWMLGWTELRFIGDPGNAYKRFYAMFNAVGTPVSKSRAAYWAGRAAAKDGHSDIAQDWYKQAAKHSTVFYGQLAASELNAQAPLRFAFTTSSKESRKKVARLSLFKAVERLHELGQEKLTRRFLTHAIDLLKEPADKVAFADALAVNLGWMHGGVVGAKQALRSHALALNYGWPLPKAPSGTLPIAPELMFAIARQESEMNPRAKSHADARGLMQLLPSTARSVARKLEVSHSTEKLYDPAHNMLLGTRYLGGLVDDWNGSWVLAIASYNAGPGNARKWVSRFGTPPRDLYKRIDWLETIPFKETRNYVQRVLENAGTYRARLKPTTPNNIVRDIVR